MAFTRTTTQKSLPPRPPSTVIRDLISRLHPNVARMDAHEACVNALYLLRRIRCGEIPNPTLLKNASAALVEFGNAEHATEALACLIRIRFWDEGALDFARTRRNAARRLSELIRCHATESDDALRVEAQHGLYAHYAAQEQWRRALACAAREVLRTHAYQWCVLYARALKELDQQDRAFNVICNLTENFEPQSIERRSLPTAAERREAWIIRSQLLDAQRKYAKAVEAFRIAESLNGVVPLPTDWRPTEWYLIRRPSSP